jgi:tRNA(Ile)-lysidine synthase
VTSNPKPAVHSETLDPSSLFRGLAERRGLILAVSGGPDSTALMLLASEWRERPPVLVVTVDHGLRPEAADEASLVARNAATLGLESRIMLPAQPRSAGNLQDWARRARYDCLVMAAREAGLDTIVTAHHQDDQAETFLLRLARGSGVYGLASMREEEEVHGIMLARPLLNVSRATLQKIASESGLEIVADPSNLDPRFDRVRMRQLMPSLAEHNIDAARLAETAARLGRAAKALDQYAGALLKAHFASDPFGVVSGPVAALATAPEEVALRSLARILRAVGGAEYTPRLSGIESLRDAFLQAPGNASLKRTLSGVVVEAAGGTLSARREWGRDGLPDMPAAGGANIVWDGRFRVAVPALAGALNIGALGRAKLRLRSPAGSRNALSVLPGLYRGETLLAAPAGVQPADEEPRLQLLAAECIVGQRLGIADEAGPKVR